MHLAANGTASRVGAFEPTSNDNDYTGTTTVGGGGGKLSVVAGNDRITLSVGDGGTTGKLGSGGVIINSPGVLKFNRNDTFSVPNLISGSGRVTADAAGGVVTLTGANTYTGTTTVNAGTLLINGTHTGGADYTVAAGATLGGTGSIGSTIIVDAGGVVPPGTSVGTFITTGGATLNGTLKIEFSGATIDKLAVGGALDITAATVDFDSLASLAGGARIFASYGSLVGAVFGGVLDLPSGFTIDYNYLGGNQIALVGGAHPGDFDSDGDVDGADFVAWQTHFPTAIGATLADGDADADGDVDGADFVVWQTNFPFTPGPGASPVPEPATALLAAVSIAGLATLRRRVRR
jgi:autotransporter-associated beta strand protein